LLGYSKKLDNSKEFMEKPKQLGYNFSMPTIIKIDGFYVMIMPNDHRPPHVHVFRAEGRVRITIGDEENRPKLMEAIGMSTKDIKKALDIVIAHQTKLIEAWREIHG
jgi:hypothetical protein